MYEQLCHSCLSLVASSTASSPQVCIASSQTPALVRPHRSLFHESMCCGATRASFAEPTACCLPHGYSVFSQVELSPLPWCISDVHVCEDKVHQKGHLYLWEGRQIWHMGVGLD